ncbi:DUF3710 domain-containing protein [Isoptericola sp. b441]|uniref:DUF3710 domain-containing protein n=1 Tax=Actinotalea lenta TaxID=3064654 RepID=A0ABT9DCL8_9CELL|nr:DUF3710 domain-containing protein [Isoptericola sp. b441]MDO8107918.1 DUF3710 domain-containing protein [Isoptericola sp. b441]
MGIFRRGAPSEGQPPHDQGVDEASVDQAATDAEQTEEVVASGGPWDVADRPERGSRIDLGTIWLPGVDGMQLRMETGGNGSVVTAAAVTIEGSSLQVQAFAAPRTAGIWEEIRTEIGESVTKQGGSVDDLPGPFGRELLARLPVRTSEGRTGHRPARFIGADGPRWFLRGVITGRAAVDPEAARVLEELFADIVVVRGPEARAPRELLTMTLPDAAPAPSMPDARGLIDPFKRGPEITEVH